MSKPELFDSHCHLNDDTLLSDLSAVMENAARAGVRQIVIPSYDFASNERGVDIAKQWPGVYAAVGIHPNDANDYTTAVRDQIVEWAQLPYVVAIGEIGLDYHWDTVPKERQFEVFREQIRLARELRLPIIIHDREAHGDIVTLLQEEDAAEVGGIMHAFSGSWEMAQICMKMNFMISFGGPVTFKNGKRPQEVAAKVPLEYLLIETDAPYLTPEPFRGKRNEPAHVQYVAQKIADLRGMDVEELARVTKANAERVFRVEESP